MRTVEWRWAEDEFGKCCAVAYVSLGTEEEPYTQVYVCPEGVEDVDEVREWVRGQFDVHPRNVAEGRRADSLPRPQPRSV